MICLIADYAFIAFVKDLLSAFQPGWEERVHTDGRIFFIDHSKIQNVPKINLRLIAILFTFLRHSYDMLGRSKILKSLDSWTGLN